MKNALFFFVVIFFAPLFYGLPASAQAGWKWGIGATGFVDGTATAIDASGNAFLAGGGSTGPDSIRFGPFSIGGIPYVMAIVKADSSGNYKWALAAYNTDGYVSPITMVADASGNIIILAEYNQTAVSIGSFSVTNPAGGLTTSTCFLVKISPTGSVLWANNLAERYAYNGGLGVDAAGNIYVSEDFTQDSISIGSATLVNSGAETIYIAKFTATGSPVWAKSIGNHGTEYRSNLVVTGDGKLFITGQYDDTLVIGHDAISGGQLFLTRFDTAGNPLWAKSLGNNFIIEALASDNSDNVYLAGLLQNLAGSIVIGPDTLTLPGANDGMFVAKADSSGNIRWARSAGGNGYGDCGYGVSTDLCGNVWVSGGQSDTMYFQGTAHTLPPAPAGSDVMFVAEYDTAGNYQASLSMPSGGDDQSGVWVDNKGNFYLEGDDDGATMIFGGDTLTNFSGNEYLFIAKYNYDSSHCSESLLTQVTNVVSETLGFILYPNPATGLLNINAQSPIQKISIANFMGQAVYTRDCNSAQVTVDVATLPPGMYFVKVNGSQVQKFVKE